MASEAARYKEYSRGMSLANVQELRVQERLGKMEQGVRTRATLRESKSGNRRTKTTRVAELGKVYGNTNSGYKYGTTVRRKRR
ncbi:MAG: hypothetical protein K6G73_12325 [Marinilabiliaceae bacterium]|nr:hypothetical protein [Marinilabiliaceae bacterium]